MRGVLPLAVELWTSGSPGGLQIPNFSKCWASPPHLAKVRVAIVKNSLFMTFFPSWSSKLRKLSTLLFLLLVLFVFYFHFFSWVSIAFCYEERRRFIQRFILWNSKRWRFSLASVNGIFSSPGAICTSLHACDFIPMHSFPNVKF